MVHKKKNKKAVTILYTILSIIACVGGVVIFGGANLDTTIKDFSNDIVYVENQGRANKLYNDVKFRGDNHRYYIGKGNVALEVNRKYEVIILPHSNIVIALKRID